MTGAARPKNRESGRPARGLPSDTAAPVGALLPLSEAAASLQEVGAPEPFFQRRAFRIAQPSQQGGILPDIVPHRLQTRAGPSGRLKGWCRFAARLQMPEGLPLRYRPRCYRYVQAMT